MSNKEELSQEMATLKSWLEFVQPSAWQWVTKSPGFDPLGYDVDIGGERVEIDVHAIEYTAHLIERAMSKK